MTHINIIANTSVTHSQFRKFYYLNKGYYCNFWRLRHIHEYCVALSIYHNFGEMNYNVSNVYYDDYGIAHIKATYDDKRIKPFYENISQYMIDCGHIRGNFD